MVMNVTHWTDKTLDRVMEIWLSGNRQVMEEQEVSTITLQKWLDREETVSHLLFCKGKEEPTDGKRPVARRGSYSGRGQFRGGGV